MEFYSGFTDSDFGWVVIYPQVFLSPLGNIAVVPSLGRLHCLSCICGVYLHQSVYSFTADLMYYLLIFLSYHFPGLLISLFVLYYMCCTLNVQKTDFDKCQKLPKKSVRVVYAFSSQPSRRQALCTKWHAPDAHPVNDWFIVLQVNAVCRIS